MPIPTNPPAGDKAGFPSHLQGTQVTVSENHAKWNSRKEGDQEDVGGDFFTQKSYAKVGVNPGIHVDTGWNVADLTTEARYVYDGPTFINEVRQPAKVSFPGYINSSNASLDMFGATAIARCAPTKPTVNLAASLLEAYREGLPKLLGQSSWQERTQRAIDLRRSSKEGAGEFLNYQFGWLPLVSDVVAFTKAVAFMDVLLQQYIRDNGKVVRRRFVFTPEVSESYTTLSSNSSPYMGTNDAQFVNFQAQPRGQVLRRRQTTVERWFSGAFIYHLPHTFFAELYSPFADKFQIFRKILGLDLTPEVLWELAPWSWAVDWFSNAGDVIHNVSAWANNGLVMKYGYVMEHSIVHDTIFFSGPTNIINGGHVTVPSTEIVSETKIRRRANPFGFGLTMGGLSALQKSILAAVGISRLS